MAEKTEIAWCDSTFNPWEGCQKVGPGCDHCYAEARNARFGGGASINWGPGAPRRRTSASNWRKPITWNNQPFCECSACGWRGDHKECKTFDEPGQEGHWCPSCGTSQVSAARRRVFCASLADVFDNEVSDEWRADLFKLIEDTPNLDWLLLTKRIGNVRGMVPLPWISKPFQHGPDPNNVYPAGWPSNVWLGITVVNQQEADRDIPKLMRLRAKVRWLSMEPLLGPVDLSRWLDIYQYEDGGDWMRRNVGHLHDMLDWVVVGGESGTNARPMHPDWPRSLRDQCAAAGVPFLFKQWGEWTPGVNVNQHSGTVETALWFADKWRFGRENLASFEGHYDDEPDLYRVGKKAAGRMLDGVEHNEYPEVSA